MSKLKQGEITSSTSSISNQLIIAVLDDGTNLHDLVG